MHTLRALYEQNGRRRATQQGKKRIVRGLITSLGVCEYARGTTKITGKALRCTAARFSFALAFRFITVCHRPLATRFRRR